MKLVRHYETGKVYSFTDDTPDEEIARILQEMHPPQQKYLSLGLPNKPLPPPAEAEALRRTAFEGMKPEERFESLFFESLLPPTQKQAFEKKLIKQQAKKTAKEEHPPPESRESLLRELAAERARPTPPPKWQFWKKGEEPTPEEQAIREQGKLAELGRLITPETYAAWPWYKDRIEALSKLTPSTPFDVTKEPGLLTAEGKELERLLEKHGVAGISEDPYAQSLIEVLPTLGVGGGLRLLGLGKLAARPAVKNLSTTMLESIMQKPLPAALKALAGAGETLGVVGASEGAIAGAQELGLGPIAQAASGLVAPFAIPAGIALGRTAAARAAAPSPRPDLGAGLARRIASKERAPGYVYERGPTATEAQVEAQLDEALNRLAQIRESQAPPPELPGAPSARTTLEDLSPLDRIRTERILATEPFARSAEDIAFLRQLGLPPEQQIQRPIETPLAAAEPALPEEPRLEVPLARKIEPKPLSQQDIKAKYEEALTTADFAGGRSETLYEALNTRPFERTAEHHLALRDAGLPTNVPMTRVRPPEGQVYETIRQPDMAEVAAKTTEMRQEVDDLLQRQAAGELLSQEEMTRLYASSDFVPLWDKEAAKTSRLGTIIDPKVQPDEAAAIRTLQQKPDEKAVETLISSPSYSHISRLAAMAPAALAGIEPAEDAEGNVYLTFDTEKAAAALAAAGALGLGAGLTSRTPRGGRFMKEVPGGIPRKSVVDLAKKHLPAMHTAGKVMPEWDGVTTTDELLALADSIQPIMPELSSEIGKLRWKVQPGKLPGNEKMQYPNEIFPQGRNTYEKAGCGRAAFIEQNGLAFLNNPTTGTTANAACYGGACYAEALVHKYGGSVAEGIRKKPVAGTSREEIKRLISERGLEEAQKLLPEYDIKTKFFVTKTLPDGQIKKVAVYDNAVDAERHAMRLGGVATEDISIARVNQTPLPIVYKVYEDAKGQDIRLGIDTDGGAFLAYKESMDGLLAANPRAVSIYSSAYGPPPEPHPLSERTIINVTVSGYHPLPETIWRLRWAEKARENGWNVVLRFVTANPDQVTKEEAKLYNRILPLLQDSDFFIIEQPLHRGSLYSEPMFFPACCQSKVRLRTCDSCEVVEGLGPGFRKFWGIPVEDLQEVMPEAFKKLSSGVVKESAIFLDPKDPIPPKQPIATPKVMLVRKDTFKVPIGAIETDADAAFAISQIRKSAQEEFVALVTNKHGFPIAVIRHSLGGRDQAIVDAKVLLGAILDTPDAGKVWFAHNHPSGKLRPSQEDLNVTASLANALAGSGVEFGGHLIVGSGAKFARAELPSMGVSEPTETTSIMTIGRRREEVPVHERKFARARRDETPPPWTTDVAKFEKHMAATYGDQAGVQLVDQFGRPLEFVPLSRSELARLRQDDVQKGLSKILRAVHRRNAAYALPYIPKTLANASDLSLNLSKALMAVKLDAPNFVYPGAYLGSPTFYANPLDPHLIKEAADFFKGVYSKYIGEPTWAFVKTHPAQVAVGALAGIRTYWELPEEWSPAEKGAVALLTGAAGGLGMHGITKIPAVKAFGRRAFGTDLPERYKELKRLRIPNEVMLLGQVRDLAEDLAKLPAAARQWLYDVRTGRVTASPQEVLAKVGDAGQRVHEQITRMTQMLVDLGALNPETAQRNINNYLHLSYQKYYDQPKLLRAMRKIRAIADELKPRGVIKEIPRHRLPMWEARGWEFFGETNRWGPKGEKLVRIRRQLTEQERDALGEIRDIAFAVAETGRLMAHDITALKFFQQVADEIAAPVQRGPDWVQVRKGKIPKTNVNRWGALENMWLPKEVYDDLAQVDFLQSILNAPMIKQLRMVNKVWKWTRTVGSPVVHWNNTMGNLTAYYLQDGSWSALASSAKDLAEAVATKRQSPELKLAIEHGVADAGYVMQELRTSQAKWLREFSRAMATDPTVGYDQTLMAKTLKGLSAIPTAAKKIPETAYELEDLVFRLGLFKTLLKQGKSPEEAASAARRGFVDYSNMPFIVEVLRELPLPFISFTAGMLPVIAESTIKRPWKLAIVALTAHAIDNLGRQRKSPEEIKKEDKLLPERLKGPVYDIPGLPPKFLRLPLDVEGRPVGIETTRMFPLGDVLEPEVGATTMIPGLPSTLQPSFGVFGHLYNAMVGYDPFLGKKLPGLGIDKMEDAKIKAEFLLRGLLPNIPGLPGTYATKQIKKSLAGEPTAFGPPQPLAVSVARGLGPKLLAPDAQALMLSKHLESKQKLQTVKDLMRRSARDRQAGLITEQQYRALIDKYTKMADKILKEHEKVMR